MGGGHIYIYLLKTPSSILSYNMENFNILATSEGLHRLEKYLNMQDCLEKSLKIKFALKSIGKILKGIEKSLNFTIYRSIQHCLWKPKSV